MSTFILLSGDITQQFTALRINNPAISVAIDGAVLLLKAIYTHDVTTKPEIITHKHSLLLLWRSPSTCIRIKVFIRPDIRSLYQVVTDGNVIHQGACSANNLPSELIKSLQDVNQWFLARS